MKSFKAIAAMAENRVIGNAGDIPWHLPEDFKWFKQTTMGCPILMGRKTYEDHQSALPGRLNIVITRQPDYPVAEGVLLAPSLEAAIELAHDREPDKPEQFIIGGVSFFTHGYEVVDRVYETVVHTALQEADAILPKFDFSNWQTTELQHHPADERHAFAFTVFQHDRRKAEE